MPSTDFIAGIAFCFPMVWAVFLSGNSVDSDISPVIRVMSYFFVGLMLASFGWGSYMILSEVFNG